MPRRQSRMGVVHPTLASCSNFMIRFQEARLSTFQPWLSSGDE